MKRLFATIQVVFYGWLVYWTTSAVYPNPTPDKVGGLGALIFICVMFSLNQIYHSKE